MTSHSCTLKSRTGVQEASGAAASPYSDASPLLCAPLSFPVGFLTGCGQLTFSVLAVLKLAPAEHCGVCFGVLEQCLFLPPSLAGLGGWWWAWKQGKSWDGIDVHGLCPLQRMSRPGKHPALSFSSMFPLQAAMGFPAWTPRRAVSARVGSRRKCGCFCACHWKVSLCSSPWIWGGHQFPSLETLGQGRKDIPEGADKAVGTGLKQQEKAKIRSSGVLGCSSVPDPCPGLLWLCGTPLMLCFR